MALDGILEDVEADFELLEAIGEQIDHLVERPISSGAVQKTIRKWLIGHAEPPEDEDAQICLMALAADLELFTPSMSGRTMVDRHLGAMAPETSKARQVVQALGAAQFRLVQVVEREGPDLVRLQDLVTLERLVLLDSRIAPSAAGVRTAMRLCPLASGRHVLISPLFVIDDAMLDEAMTFVRPGRAGLQSQRCAASLYRNIARRGFQPMPQLATEMDPQAFADFLHEAEQSLTPIQRLALDWIADKEDEATLIQEARRLTSHDNMVDVFGCYGAAASDGFEPLLAIYGRIAAVQIETVASRAKAGLGSAAGLLDQVASEIYGHVASGRMQSGARELFDRLRRRWTSERPQEPEAGAAAMARSELDRVIERIRALRTKTVERGCTEAEAMAAAAKVSDLLERFDLTLDEVSVRQSQCEGVSVSTGRKRRGPVDGCMPEVAAFTDCRVWAEQGADGVLRFVFFGLRADVEAARFLHDLIEATFETESLRFKQSAVYQALRGGDRRIALNSFQSGLASGIAGKLRDLKDRRRGAAANSTGFDLVAVKYSVVDDEMTRLGLRFKTRSGSSRRYVHGEAYQAGKAAGSLFEPDAALPG